MNQRDWVHWAFGKGCQAALNMQINGLADTHPGPDDSGAEYRKWWWRGYYYQLDMIEHPQQAELSPEQPEPFESPVTGGRCVSAGDANVNRVHA